MKNLLFFLFTISLSNSLLLAQTKEALETEIKNLEQAEVSAILAMDYEKLTNLWAPDFMVNNPANTVLKSRSEVFERMNQGIIHYSEYRREIEEILIMEGMVIVMGEETVKPKGVAPMTGKTLRRRYTNFWREIDGRWQVQARHANVIGAD
ncbi:nuclear transport factor 2 family protein [Algoriphagus sp.]|uniref:nuclear transport factor 2 family protein n=1 Tax=Algoriphagus sp. TaxID=1872435 RepID=UPI00391AAF63